MKRVESNERFEDLLPVVNAGGRSSARASLRSCVEVKFLTKFHLRLPNRLSPREQNGVDDRLCYLLAETFASDVVGSEVLAGINSAQSCLLRSR